MDVAVTRTVEPPTCTIADMEGYPPGGELGPVHYGGQLSWGPDGLLYLSTGDKTKSEWVQSHVNGEVVPSPAALGPPIRAGTHLPCAEMRTHTAHPVASP